MKTLRMSSRAQTTLVYGLMAVAAAGALALPSRSPDFWRPLPNGRAYVEMVPLDGKIINSEGRRESYDGPVAPDVFGRQNYGFHHTAIVRQDIVKCKYDGRLSYTDALPPLSHWDFVAADPYHDLVGTPDDVNAYEKTICDEALKNALGGQQ